MLAPLYSQIIVYLNNRLQELCQVKPTYFANLGKKVESSRRLQNEFKLISYLANVSYDLFLQDEKTTISISSVQADGLLESLLKLLMNSAIRSLKSKPGGKVVVNNDASAVKFDLALLSGESVESELVKAIVQLTRISENVGKHLKYVYNK